MIQNWLRSWGNWGAPFASFHTASRINALAQDDTDDAMRFGPVVIAPHRHEVRVHGELVPLTAMETAILRLLASRPGMVFTAKQIAEKCHEGPAAVQPRSVNRRVQSLRQKLGDAGGMIANMRGVGYCLRVEANDMPWARWWSLAPLMAWWSQRGPSGKVAAVSCMLGLSGAALLAGGLAAREGGWSNPRIRGVELIAAASWRPEAIARHPGTAERLSLEAVQVVEPWAGVGSSIVYTGEGDRFLVLSDRGYEDGTSDRACRWHSFRITPRGDGSLDIQWLSETPLTDEAGVPLRGGTARLEARYDPEAIQIDRAGNVWLAEEYGPSIDMFSPDGRRLRRLSIPERYRVARPHRNPDRERRDNVTGRAPNRGFEALALDEDAQRLFAITQSPLIQDGGEGGRFVRILELSLNSPTSREWVYELETPGDQVSEMAMVDGRLLVLERDLHAGDSARFKRLFTVELDQASDVSQAASLPADALPTDVVPVKKRLVADLLSVARRAEGLTVYDQFEGLCPGPTDDQGRPTLIVASDNGRAGAVLGELMNVYVLALDAPVVSNHSSSPIVPMTTGVVTTADVVLERGSVVHRTGS